ncbi:unnamed protein product [Citrullus colocynthis]|uniref:Uncharacterized protein n=1 Tax=Citrullus colocynthis TaxID=252529 RepID=A0ABP0YE00_9ROSI
MARESVGAERDREKGCSGEIAGAGCEVAGAFGGRQPLEYSAIRNSISNERALILMGVSIDRHSQLVVQIDSGRITLMHSM